MPAPPTPPDMPARDLGAADMREDLVDDLDASMDMLPAYEGPLIKDSPRGLVWPNNPTRDEETEQVVLGLPTDPTGALDAPGYSIYLCANEEGEELYLDGGLIGYLCDEVQRAFPERGEYLHLKPPMNMASADDSFSEVHTYFHIAQIEHYFGQTLGWQRAPEHLSVITNYQYKLTPSGALELGGRTGWNVMDNAFFIEAGGVPVAGAVGREDPALIFGQGLRVDYSYDTSIVYHEYVHALIGDAFRDDFVDLYGINTTPRAINEGLADFFAATFREDPRIGEFALSPNGPLAVRDVSIKRTCPEDMIGQYHSDGQILSSMLWHLRGELGDEVLLPLVLHTIESADSVTGFDTFARLLSAEAAIAGAETARAVNAAIDTWGLKGCDRARPIGSYQAGVDALPPLHVPGLLEVTDPIFTEWTPAPIQLVMDVPRGKSVQITWYQNSGSLVSPPTPLDLAIKHHTPLRLSTEGGVATFDEDALFEVPIENISAQTITLPPECLADGDRVYLLLRNGSTMGAQVNFLATYILDAPSEGRNVVSCSF